MRSTVLGLAVCLLAHLFANAKTASARDHEDFPYQTSVSEVSKDGHPIHNRLTFDCAAADGAGGRPPMKIDCVMVQQDLEEPSPPPSKGDLDKVVAEMTDGDKLKELCLRESAGHSTAKSQQEVEFREKVARACSKANRTAVLSALTDIYRDMAETASQTCTMATVVFRFTFAYVKKGVWVSYPDPIRSCTNVACHPNSSCRRQHSQQLELHRGDPRRAGVLGDGLCLFMVWCPLPASHQYHPSSVLAISPFRVTWVTSRANSEESV